MFLLGLHESMYRSNVMYMLKTWRTDKKGLQVQSVVKDCQVKSLSTKIKDYSIFIVDYRL